MGVVQKQGIANALVVYIGTIIGAISLLYVQPTFLTKAELGTTRLILAFGTVLASVLSFGISSVTVRYLPRVLDRSTGHRGFFGFMLLYVSTSVLIGTALVYILRGPLALAYGAEGGIFQDNLKYVLTLAVAYSFVLGLNAYSLALLRSVFPTLLNDIVIRLLFIGVVLAYATGWIDVNGFLALFCGAYVAQALILLLYILIVDRPVLTPDLGHLRAHIGLRPILRYGAIITFTAINSVTLKYIDSIFVGQAHVEDTAVYSVAAFIGLFIEVPLLAMERIANPVISHALAAGDMEPIKVIYHRSAHMLLLLGGWMFAMVVLNVNDLLQLLPAGYHEGALVTITIAFGALINMATGINHPILVNSDRYIYGSVFLVALLGLTVLGNFLLIPHLGMLGAAVTACVASIIYNALKFEFIRRRYGLQPFDANTAWTWVLIVVAVVGVWLIPMPENHILSMVLRGMLCTTLFVLAIWKGGLGRGLEGYLPASIRSRF